MHAHNLWTGARRTAPRVEIEGFCSEIVDGRERHGLALDLSEGGLRITRPWRSGVRTPREVQLEFEIPGVDEIIWARAEICFDQLRQGAAGLVRTSGLRLAAAASRDLRLLRDWVMAERRRLRDAFLDESAFVALAPHIH